MKNLKYLFKIIIASILWLLAMYGLIDAILNFKLFVKKYKILKYIYIFAYLFYIVSYYLVIIFISTTTVFKLAIYIILVILQIVTYLLTDKIIKDESI